MSFRSLGSFGSFVFSGHSGRLGHLVNINNFNITTDGLMDKQHQDLQVCFADKNMPYLNVPYYCLQDDHPEHVAQGPDHQERAGGQPPAGLGALRVREVASSHDLAQPRGASLPRRIQVRTYRDKARGDLESFICPYLCHWFIILLQYSGNFQCLMCTAVQSF